MTCLREWLEAEQAFLGRQTNAISKLSDARLLLLLLLCTHTHDSRLCTANTAVSVAAWKEASRVSAGSGSGQETCAQVCGLHMSDLHIEWRPAKTMLVNNLAWCTSSRCAKAVLPVGYAIPGCSFGRVLRGPKIAMTHRHASARNPLVAAFKLLFLRCPGRQSCCLSYKTARKLMAICMSKRLHKR